jgi:hypothetical protein
MANPWFRPGLLECLHFFNRIQANNAILHYFMVKIYIFFIYYYNFMVKINTFLGRVVAFFARRLMVRANQQGQNTGKPFTICLRMFSVWLFSF